MNDESDPETWGQCSGHCCEAFALPYSPDELREVAAEKTDGEEVANMVVPLGHFKQNPRQRVVGDNGGGPGVWFYTCRHHDACSGRCTIYEKRPQMCRSYPNDGRCKFLNCTRVANTSVLTMPSVICPSKDTYLKSVALQIEDAKVVGPEPVASR